MLREREREKEVTRAEGGRGFVEFLNGIFWVIFPKLDCQLFVTLCQHWWEGKRDSDNKGKGSDTSGTLFVESRNTCLMHFYKEIILEELIIINLCIRMSIFGD